MSYSAIIAFDQTGAQCGSYEFSNAHGGGPYIWTALSLKYGLDKYWWKEGALDLLWDAMMDGSKPEHDVVAFLFPFDRYMVRSAELAKFAEHLEKFYRGSRLAMRDLDHVCSIEGYIRVCEALALSDKVHSIALYANSVSSDDVFCERHDEDDECIPFNPLHHQCHWLYDESAHQPVTNTREANPLPPTDSEGEE